jgi:hypothetical protein
MEGQSNESQRTERERSFAAVVNFLKAQPGQALCEEPMFCFEAGKPKVYDAFNAGEVFKTCTLPESAVLVLLEARAFGAIQLNWSPSDPVRPSKPRYSRFTDTFVRELFATYRPSIQTPSADLHAREIGHAPSRLLRRAERGPPWELMPHPRRCSRNREGILKSLRWRLEAV